MGRIAGNVSPEREGNPPGGGRPPAGGRPPEAHLGGPLPQVSKGPLLAAASTRLKVAVAAVAILWAAVLWAAMPPSGPADKGEPAARPASALRVVAASGRAAPGGGVFDRFDISSQPIVAPVNARGQVAFFATVVRGKS